MEIIENYKQFYFGTVILILGLCIYIFGRNFIPVIAVPADIYIYNQFDVPGNFFGFLPSFVHPIAFCLLCAAFFKSNKLTYVTICLAWGGVHILFETVQSEMVYSWMLPIFDIFGRDNILIRYVEHYSRTGTFDIMDLLSVVVGCVVAFYLLRLTQHASIKREVPN